MKVFLFSPIKCAVSLNDGKAFLLDQNPVALDYFGGDIWFSFSKDYELCRLNFNCKLYENCSIIDLYEGFLCIPYPVRKNNLPYKELFKSSIVIMGVEHFFTVFTDGSIKLSCQGYRQNSVLDLPFLPKGLNCKYLGGNLILIELSGDPSYLYILSAKDFSLVFSCAYDSYEINKKLIVKRTHKSAGIYEEIATYDFDGGFNLSDKRFTAKYLYKSIPNEVLPYIFLEEVRLGVDYRHFLSDELKSDHELISQYFGKINFVLPPFFKAFKDNFLLISSECRFAKITSDNGIVQAFQVEKYPI